MHNHYKEALAEKEQELEHVLALLESEKLNNRSFIQKAKKKLQRMFPFSR